MAKNLVKFFIIVDSYKIQILSRFLTETWDKRGLNDHDDSDNDIVRKNIVLMNKTTALLMIWS